MYKFLLALSIFIIPSLLFINSGSVVYADCNSENNDRLEQCEIDYIACTETEEICNAIADACEITSATTKTACEAAAGAGPVIASCCNFSSCTASTIGQIFTCASVLGSAADTSCTCTGAGTGTETAIAATPATPTTSGADTTTAADTTMGNPLKEDNPVAIIGNIIRAMLGVVGAVTLLMFIYGGFMLIFSGGEQEKLEKGRKTLIWAIIGLAIILSSYSILSYVFKILITAT